MEIRKCTFLIMFLLVLQRVKSFWPPPYTVNLEDKDNFVISLDASISEDDEEMIQKKDINSLKLNVNDRKLKRFHKQFKRNPRHLEKSVKQSFLEGSHGIPKKIWKRMQNELFPEMNDPKFLTNYLHKRNANESEQYDEEQEVIILSSTSQPEQYDYELFKQEYYNEIKEDEKSSDYFNYTEKGKHEDSIKDAVKEIVDIKKPKNCSREESKNFGIKSAECLWEDFKKTHTKMDKIKLLKRILKFIAVWVIIYIVIAIPCWCKYGLCCCCCCCDFCRPRRVFYKAKKYVTNNPPGILIENGEVKEYEPTAYETEIYNNLLRSIRKL